MSPLESHELAGFTIRARKVLQLANQEAQRLNHDYVGAEHLLLGVVKDKVGVASQVLEGLDFNLRKARTEVAKVAPPNSHQPMMGTLPRNADAQKALGCALEEAKNLPIGLVVGLVTQSWIAFAVTFVLVVVGYTCRRGYGPRPCSA